MALLLESGSIETLVARKMLEFLEDDGDNKKTLKSSSTIDINKKLKKLKLTTSLNSFKIKKPTNTIHV